MTTAGRSLRVLTWHVHGNYLYYLSQVPHTFYLPVTSERGEGYGGRSPGFPWPKSVVEVPAERVRDTDFDCVLYQSHRNWEVDRDAILSDAQKRLPQIFLEHDPPRLSPTDTKHPVDDPEALVVHVTHFNELMWDCGRSATCVIEHGVIVPDDVEYRGDIERGVSVVNGLGRRGRRLGSDVFAYVRERVPIDLVGMLSEECGGIGEIPHRMLPLFEADYRFFFNPIRYTSLGLAVCEAMMLGMPIVGLATTEMVRAVDNGVTGYVDTEVDALVERMRELLADPSLAHRLGANAREAALERYGIQRFARDWDRALKDFVGDPGSVPVSATPAGVGV